MTARLAVVPDALNAAQIGLQAALTKAGAAGGGKVRVPNGLYEISAPLTIYSGTHLDLDPDATIRLADGSALGHMLRNAAYAPQRTVADAAISIGDATMSSATAGFTSADIGRTVVIVGARINSAPLVAEIMSINGGTSVELSVAAGATVTGASCSIHTRDHDIAVTGGYWDKGQNGNVIGSLAHGLMMRHLDGFVVRDFSGTSANNTNGYQISLGDVTDVVAEHLAGDDCFSDIIHIAGPAASISVNGVFGASHDDAVGITATEGLAYVSYRDTAGDIIDLSVVNVFAESGSAHSVRLCTGDGTRMDRIKVSGIHNASGPVWGITHETGIVDIGSMHLERIHGYGYAQDGGQIDDLTIRDIVYEPTENSRPAVQMSSSVRKLTIAGARCKTTHASALLLLMDATQTMEEVAVSDVNWDGGNGTNLVRIFGGVVTVGKLSISRFHFHANDTPLIVTQNGTAVPVIFLSDGRLSVWSQLGSLDTTTALYLSNVSTNYYGVEVASNGVVTVRGAGMVPGLASVTSGGSLSSQSLDFRVDVSLLTKHAGDMAYNTNAALACGVGPVICDGANWKHLYSGATY